MVRELQLDNTEAGQTSKFEYKDRYLFENFNLALQVRDIFLNPLHPDKMSRYKCEMGKEYKVSY